jgi:4-hydroxythreonine-4-phosphate dehydrogenase
MNPHAGMRVNWERRGRNIKTSHTRKRSNRKIFSVLGPILQMRLFARGQHEKFDAVLAMYHDQG